MTGKARHSFRIPRAAYAFLSITPPTFFNLAVLLSFYRFMDLPGLSTRLALFELPSTLTPRWLDGFLRSLKFPNHTNPSHLSSPLHLLYISPRYFQVTHAHITSSLFTFLNKKKIPPKPFKLKRLRFKFFSIHFFLSLDLCLNSIEGEGRRDIR